MRSRLPRFYRPALIFAAGLAVTACATTDPSVARDASRKQVDVPEVWRTAAAAGDVQVGWIDAFNDPVMSDLVREAQNNNRDLIAAAANVDRAWALARQAGATLLPSVTGTAGTTNSGTGGSSGQGSASLGLQASWEVDLWGRVRSGQQGAVSSAEAAAADYKFAQHSLAASVARGYFLAIEADLQQEIAQQRTDALEETLRIVNVRRENGMASAQDLALSRSDLATAREQLTAAQAAKRQALRSLEVLLGRYPSADLEVAEALPELPATPPAGLPSTLLERRPDLIAAERRVAAAFNALDQAQAAKLPSLSLTGSVGGSSSALSEITDPSNVIWQLGSSLLAPLFDGGARQAAVDAANADQRAALAAYGQAALSAFSEIETRLDQGAELAQREEQLKIAADNAQEAYRLAQLRYKEGASDLLDVLTIQQRVNGADSSLINLQRGLLEQRINLNLALGGDWD